MSYSIQKPLPRSGKTPSARGGSSLVYADGKLILFGGHYFAGEGKFAYLDETWLYDIEKVAWYSIPCSGDIPIPRYGHTAHIVGSRMFIFGGKGTDGVMLKDVCFLDLVEWIWVPVSTLSQGPLARMYHASELVGRKIVVHGGWDGTHVYNDFWIFNTDSFAWMQPKASGFAPTARFGHTLNLVHDGRLVMFGGCSISQENGLPSYHDDVRQLDTDSMIWTRPRTEGQSPTGRFGHSAIVLNDKKIIIFGGWGKNGCQSHEMNGNPNAITIQTLDPVTMTWNIPKTKSKKSFRHVHNHACCSSNSTESTMFFFGGFDGQQAVNELVILDFHFGGTGQV